MNLIHVTSPVNVLYVTGIVHWLVDLPEAVWSAQQIRHLEHMQRRIVEHVPVLEAVRQPNM